LTVEGGPVRAAGGDGNEYAKKILYVRLIADRTVNGHTWARRVSSGARENHG